MKYDIIIPCVKYDIDFLPKVICYIRKNLSDADIIYIITSKSNFKKLNTVLNLGNNLRVIDEDALVEGMSFLSLRKVLEPFGAERRTGWYLQQFLKMGFSLSKWCNKYYLSWDADTLPLRNIKYFDGDNHPLFTRKEEYNEPYFHTMKKLIGYGKTAEFSFIAEHMMFEPSIMQEIIYVIENCKVEGKKWFIKILNACELKDSPSFSEFETYGTYVWNKYPDMYKTQKLNTFRAAGLIKGRKIDDRTIALLAFDLDTASFEQFHVPPFPYCIQHYRDAIQKRIDRFINRIKSIRLK